MIKNVTTFNPDDKTHFIFNPDDKFKTAIKIMFCRIIKPRTNVSRRLDCRCSIQDMDDDTCTKSKSTEAILSECTCLSPYLIRSRHIHDFTACDSPIAIIPHKRAKKRIRKSTHITYPNPLLRHSKVVEPSIV